MTARRVIRIVAEVEVDDFDPRRVVEEGSAWREPDGSVDCIPPVTAREALMQAVGDVLVETLQRQRKVWGVAATDPRSVWWPEQYPWLMDVSVDVGEAFTEYIATPPAAVGDGYAQDQPEDRF
jgi:hypothetical protein